jgi:effector-binding domain-containing protein
VNSEKCKNRKEETMKKAKLLAAMVVMGLAVGLVWAQEKAEKKEPAKISTRKIEAQTVLYIIYRGPYEKIGQPIGGLYALAGKSRIAPIGAVSLVYLNNPALVSPEHYLTEIRIPVGEEAKKLAGTLGPMTDVKSLKAQEVAVVEKAPGDANYGAIYGRLYEWIGKNGYRSIDNPIEVFPNSEGGDYEKMKSEVMVPVAKAASPQ